MGDSPAKPIWGELAASGDADPWSRQFVGELLLPDDEVLSGNAHGDLRVYQRLKRDSRVQACWQQRVRALIARDWVVEPGGTKRIDRQAADFLRETLERLQWDRITERMLNGIFYGYSVGECLWRPHPSGRVELADIKVRKPWRFRWDRDGALCLISREAPYGIAMPPNKFWVYTAGADDDDTPYGRGLGYYLYWPVWFKRNGARFWAQFLDKFASPTVVGTAPVGADDDEKRKALAVLRSIGRDSAAVIPQGTEVKLLESVRNSGGNFSDFVGYWDAEITMAILSQTLTSEKGASEAQARVHQEMMLNVVKGDADLICASFRAGPATWLTEWNFSGAAVPLIYRDCASQKDLKAMADRDAVIQGLGFTPTLDYIRRTYGDGWVETPGAARPPANAAPVTSVRSGLADFASNAGFLDFAEEGDPHLNEMGLWFADKGFTGPTD